MRYLSSCPGQGHQSITQCHTATQLQCWGPEAGYSGSKSLCFSIICGYLGAIKVGT